MEVNDDFGDRISKWKKLENALAFINTARRLSKEAKYKSNLYFPRVADESEDDSELHRKSKWRLLRNVISAVNYLARVPLNKLVINFSEASEKDSDDSETQVELAGGRRQSERSLQHWSTLRNSLHWIRLRTKAQQ